VDGWPREAWRAKGADIAVADIGDEAALTKALTGATGANLLLRTRSRR